jgi:hypothetical protein
VRIWILEEIFCKENCLTNSYLFNIRATYPYGGVSLLFGHKNKPQARLQVDLGDLQNEKEQLTTFLQTHLDVSVSSVQDKLTVNSEKMSAQELQHAVTKFVYHRNLNNTHWVSTEGATVKINRFKGTDKKTEKNKKEPPHQTAAQSWGL